MPGDSLAWSAQQADRGRRRRLRHHPAATRSVLPSHPARGCKGAVPPIAACSCPPADSLAALAFLLADATPLAVEAAKRDLCACGFECWETDIGAPGVTLHSSSALNAEVLHALSES